MRYYLTHGEIRGDGLLNSAINNLPFELHLPGYNFCGPGTKLKKRLERGDIGVNPLDEACKEHDISYSINKELSDRHKADQILLQKALHRFSMKDVAWKEKLAALGVVAAMKTKIKLGMGSNNRFGIKSENKLIGASQQSQSSNATRMNNSIVNKTSKIMQRTIQVMQNYLKEMEFLVDKLKGKTVNKTPKNKVLVQKKRVRKVNADNVDEKADNYHEKKIKEKMLLNSLKAGKKRKLNIDNFVSENKNNKKPPAGKRKLDATFDDDIMSDRSEENKNKRLKIDSNINLEDIYHSNKRKYQESESDSDNVFRGQDNIKKMKV